MSQEGVWEGGVQGSWFRVHGSEFRVQGSWFKVQDSGFQGAGYVGCRVSQVEVSRFLEFRYWVPGFQVPRD